MRYRLVRAIRSGLMPIVLCAPVMVHSQGSDAPAPSDSALVRAQQLVNAGHGDAGRAIVDSLLAATAGNPGQYAEVLFWHASLASTAAVAEHDYRRLAVEFPLSGRAEDALLRLAQLEIARNDMALALRHLERLMLEHPTSPARTRAMYWMGRIHAEQGNVAKACASFTAALAAVPPPAIELRNQIDYHAQRCGVRNTAAAASSSSSSTSASVTAPTAATGPPPPAPSPAPPLQVPAATERAEHYAIQVAAFSTRAGAEELSARLKARGHDARITGATAPFRVRVGRYVMRSEANRMAQELIASGIVSDAFVTVAETP